ncbi:G-protein coupled receptor 98, partial [Biomphalaria glabrata]
MTDTAISVQEGDYFNVRITIFGSSPTPFNIIVEVENDLDGDFVGVTQVASVPAGVTGGTNVVFSAKADGIPEDDELFYMRLYALDPSILVSSPNRLAVTVKANDNAFGVFSISEVSPIIAYESLYTTVTRVKVQRTVSFFRSVIVFFMLNSTSDAAVIQGDIAPASGFIKFQPQQTEGNIELQIIADNIPENQESFFVIITSAYEETSQAGVLVNSSSVELIIAANDAPIRFSNAEYRYEEGPGDISYNISVTRGFMADGSAIGPINNVVTVEYTFLSGTAMLGEDFTGTNGVLMFGPGETVKTFTLVIIDDTVPETQESFSIKLVITRGDAVFYPESSNTATIFIGANDNPSGTISFKPDPGGGSPTLQVNEDSFVTVQFVVQRIGGTFGNISADWYVDRDSGNVDPITNDVGPSKGRLDFREGQNQSVIELTIVQDNDPEPSELFTITLYAPNSVIRLPGNSLARLLIEDSDNYYGTVEFGPSNDHRLFTNQSGRLLQLSLTRSGGRFADLYINITVSYSDAYIKNPEEAFVQSTRRALMPNGEDPVKISFQLNPSTFLVIGGEFKATIIDLGLNSASRYGAFNSPRIGTRRQISTVVSSLEANGETGFFNVTNQVVDEPSSGVLQVGLLVSREGLSGRAVVSWSLSGTDVTSDDVSAFQGTVVLESGMSSVMLNIGIKADDIPELDEFIMVRLDSIEPNDTQRLRPGLTSVTITVRANDNPGGILQFSQSKMNLSYSVREGVEAVNVVVERLGGALQETSVQYSIEPNGTSEFFGAINILVFRPGVREMSSTFLAKKDGIPELDETFTLFLTLVGNAQAVIGNRSRIAVTILENDNPYGVIRFFTDPTIIYTDEGQPGEQLNVTIPVQRDYGTFSRVSVAWRITPSPQFDLTPSSGTLVFEAGQSQQYIILNVVNDDIPELDETYAVQMSSPDNKAVAGIPMVATIVILENDNPVEFAQPLVYAIEPQTITLTLSRQGRIDKESRVHYRTLDGSASSVEKDYLPILVTELVFAVNQRERTIQVIVLDDDLPEQNETFYVQLFDVSGDLIVTKNSTATIVILANDDAYGVFNFSQPPDTQIEEGSTFNFEVVRSRGNFESVRVYWELRSLSNVLLLSGQDFNMTKGQIDFSSQENKRFLPITPLADGIPEPAEQFLLTLTRVEVLSGITSGGLASLAKSGLVVTVQVAASDDPNGRLAFASFSRELSVAEDFYPGNEASTRATFVVERRQGNQNLIKVLWEVYSDQLGSNIPTTYDLLFSGQWPSSMILVNPVSIPQRQGTTTPIAYFNGASVNFITVSSVDEPALATLSADFSLSAWVLPNANTNGYILSRCTSDGGTHYYSLKLVLTATSTTIQLRLSTRVQTNQLLSVDSTTLISDGSWHHILVAVLSNSVNFYLDGKRIGSIPIVDSPQLEGPGLLLVGSRPPGIEMFTGYMQDVRIMMRGFEDGTVRELFLMMSSKDVTPISGVMTYNTGEILQNFTVASIQDIEEEGREVFVVLLIDTTGGATLSTTDARTTLTVQKSDYANGLFSLVDCSPSRILYENTTVTCSIQRSRGDDGTVSVSWVVNQVLGSTQQQASSDFDNSIGMVVFLPGERIKTFEIIVRDDNLPELDESFVVSLVVAVSDDGLIGSTNTSGAVLDSSALNKPLTITENDYPYGYLQFSNQLGAVPAADILIPPTTSLIQVSVKEEGGLVPLVVLRAQGTIGTIRADWRTKDITALSEGKSPPDYVGGVGSVVMGPSINFAWINITVIDNTIPEAAKTFEVELFSPTGGAVLSPGSNKVQVTIQASDGAFGFYQFDDSYLNMNVNEEGDDGYNVAKLQVNRLNGTIGISKVAWEVQEDLSDGIDIINQNGTLTFQPDQRTGFIELQVKGETIPELDETVIVKLTQVLGGDLGDSLRRTARITILANDDPYGKFVIMSAFRPIKVIETLQDVNITVQRLGGQFGSVQVDFTSLGPNERYNFLPSTAVRADLNDFVGNQGTLSFGPNQELAQFKIQILDDQIPEEDESVFVRLTATRLVQAAQINAIPNSPTLGQNSETYGQIIILANDDANGRLQLFPPNVSVSESVGQIPVNVTRTGGTFGEVSVIFRVIDGSAVVNQDFIVLSSVVILPPGVTSRLLDIQIIDDIIPERAEYFTIELQDSATGGAVLGDQRTSVVTILPSDDPNGVFAFGAQGLKVLELDQAYTVNITVLRIGGSMDTATVSWEARLNGVPASDDISPSSGSISFVTNEVIRSIAIRILPDDIPEGDEDIVITLTNVTNGARIGEQKTYILTILANDSPHGTVQLSSSTIVIAEDPAEGTQSASVVRSGGTFGAVRVYYSTSAMSLLELNALSGGNVLTLFLPPLAGLPSSLSGSVLNVTQANDALQACATYCAQESSCVSFMYQQTLASISCLWYTSTFSSGSLQQGLNANFYEKDVSRMSQLRLNLATAGADFTVVTRMSIVLQDGQTTGLIQLPIINDNIPELDEQFFLTLVDAEVVNSTTDVTDSPLLGSLLKASIVITASDNAFGQFVVLNPSDPSSRVVQVQEINKLAVDLVVERQGGTYGNVSIEWSISLVNRTATYGEDYIADGATLLFLAGQNRRVITLTILDDAIPEENEELTVIIANPRGGATLSNLSFIKVVILANDNVAGVLSFDKSSVLVNEGDVLQLRVKRTNPAHGTVTAQWIIQAKIGVTVSTGFSQYTGILTFIPFETEKILNLTILADSTPKEDREYTLSIQNITTDGVAPTGWAAVDPQLGSVLITIAGNNDPNGVFQLSSSSLDLRVQENVGTARLLVDRKFGSIGSVNLSYEVIQGSLKPLGTQRHLANVGQDFIGISPGFLIIGNGETFGYINVTVFDDDVPEIDEVFIVRLIGVSLMNSTKSTLLPRLASNSTQTEVTIAANDGAQGIFQFATDSQIVTVSEQGQTIALTIVRGNGTFGQVSLFVYSQPVTPSTILGVDYNMSTGEIIFQEGESRNSVMITIIDDNEPEPDETFEVILANPSNGALLGQASRARVTILANDVSGGLISFSTSEPCHLREATAEDSSFSKAEILVSRTLGTFGVVSVPFIITSSDGQLTTDVIPANGSIFFSDRQAAAVLTLEAVNDEEPELAENFTLTLLTPSNGAILGNITTKAINIDQSDSPWGLLQIYPSNTGLTSIATEEIFTTLSLDVVRSKGTLGKVTVKVVTIPGSATATTNISRVVLAPIAEVLGASVSDWYQFLVGDTDYILMLTSLPDDIQLNTYVTNGSILGAGQSVLYKWQGQMTYLSTLSTNGATAATSFTISNITYLVVANGGREGKRQVSTNVYKVSGQGTLQIIQSLSTSGASDVEYFQLNSRHFIFVTNALDDISKSDISSYLYEWDLNTAQFNSAPRQIISTLYAKSVTSFNIYGQIYLAVANYYDRTIGSYEISSIVYRLDATFNLIQHQRITTQGAVSLAYLEVTGFSFLVIANYRQNVIASPQDSVVYRWDYVAQQFVLHQIISTTRALKVSSVISSQGSVLLVFANELGNSEIFIWDVPSNTFKSVWKGSTYLNLKPITIKQPDVNLVMLASSELTRETKPTMFQIAQLANNSDYMPRQVTMSFEPGQTLLRTSVAVLLDDIPEDTESFTVSLVSPTGGAELGQNNTVRVDILANDDAYGIIEFSPDSLTLTAEEKEGKDTPVSLVVLRRRGFSGYVSVAWQATGNQNGVGDLTPLSGQVDFASGQSVATITLTVRDDQEPELDEDTYITLTQILNAGTADPNKGAKLGEKVVAKLTVLANDSPYGVVAWEKTLVTVQEPDKSDTSVQLGVVREQGLNMTIRVYYVTSIASQLNPLEQATPGQDFVMTQGYVEMTSGTSRAVVSVVIKADDLPEGPETFLVNLTSVSLLTNSQILAGGPSIAIGRNIIQVVIAENDNAQGLVEFSVKTNNEGRVDVYEEYGRNVTIELALSRLIGYFGSLTVTWQTDPREAGLQDYSPASGTVQFNDQQKNASIFIVIIDDTIPENLETFDVKLIGITGNAQLGTFRQVRVGILKNDSPTGLFRFATTQVTTQEGYNNTDPNGQAVLIVQRVQGTQGAVNVQWRLNAEALLDFMPPLENIIYFAQGETEKPIVLQTRQDNILEGREEFTASLVAVDNNADISNSAGDCKIIIQPDPGASGTISILPDYRWIIVGEPGESSPSYTGIALVNLTRGLGIFGEVTITWSLTPRDLSAFLQVEGSLTFSDLQQTASIVLQTLDDSLPEISQTYTLQVTSANNGANISTGESLATVVFAASDYPNGLVQFTLPQTVIVSEDQGTVQVSVTRTKGLIGQLQVAYTTTSGMAVSNQDFRPAAGVLTFQSGVNTQLVEVYIIPDDIPEGPEDFYINLTSVQLVNDNNNYTLYSGLSRDMRPALGPLSTKIVTIDKNDNSEGKLQFNSSTYQVKEESLVARLTIVRTGGTYGQVGVSYKTQGAAATDGIDYMPASGIISLSDGTTSATINITIIDDTLMEADEDFKVLLFDPTGGALLGSINITTVIILKSDYPNGRFAFAGPASINLQNSPSTVKQILNIERTAGSLGQQQVFWRLMGPNNPNMVLDDTRDISILINGQEVTSSSLIWQDGELGVKQLTFDIKGYTTWEVEKLFVVEIYKVSGSPAGVGDGEVDDQKGNVVIKIDKYGDPSGIIRFTDAAITPREILEPDGSVPEPLVFPVTRGSVGTIGNIQVYWELRGNDLSSPDVAPSQGTLLFLDSQRDGVITLQILPDDIPELTEYFNLVLVRVEGGATIDSQYNQSTFSIRYNDNPHGVFGLIPENQAIVVNSADLSRQVKLNISRFQGTFGSVIITFTINYDLIGSDVSLSSKSGTVTFVNGSSEATSFISLLGTGFLKLGSTFTAYLTDVQFLGPGVTTPPSFKVGMEKAQITVPSIAANSELSFSSDITFVNEADQTVTATIIRSGTYGALTIDWRAGYSISDLPVNVTNGEISPAVGTVAMNHGQQQVNITVQLFPKVNKIEAFVLQLPQTPQTLVSGGARLSTSPLLVRIEPSGLVRISNTSLLAQTSELEEVVTLTLWRLYGSEGLIAVTYQTIAGTAQAYLDFEPISGGLVSFYPLQTVATIQIKIRQDNIPEETELFYVNLTKIEKFPTPIQPALSPRLSQMYSLSQVSIRESNDPYGVLSLKPTFSYVNETFTTVTLTVSRTGGLFGSVSVTVRTVGGGESWTSQIVANIDSPTNNTIADVIGKRNSKETATGGMDYEILNTVVQFQAQESEKTVGVTILEDNIAEPQETILIYITQPTGGARVATGSLDDNGQKGYAVIYIAASDLSNGLVGFAESSQSVHVDEDTSPMLVLKLTRLNAYFGTIKVNWKAKRSVNSSDQEDADLSSQLVKVAGFTTCPAEKSDCDLIVNIINDDIPEESYSFIVLLTGVDTDAQLNQNSLVASVIIDPSDYVRGLVQFAQNSREIIAGENDVSVKLSVEKVKGQKYNVTVAFNTEQMQTSVLVYGVKVYPALDRADFQGQSNSLSFLANTQESQYITLTLSPVTASDNPLPKQFYVTLTSPTNGASINPNASRAVIRIVKTSDVAIWTIVSKPGVGSLANDDVIISVVGQLNELAQTNLNIDNLILVEDVLNKINQQGNQRKLPTEVLNAVRNLFCKLLDDAINDARKGRSSLAGLLESFAYVLIKDTTCPPSLDSDMISTQCSAVTISAGRWLPSKLAGYTFNIQTKDSFVVSQTLPEVDTAADGTSDQCIDFHVLDYNSVTWFDTSSGENPLINKKVVGFGLKGRQSGVITSPVQFTVHTPDRRIAARDAKCVYFDESTRKWVNPNDVCQVKNDLSQAVDDFVNCECSHMSSYSVTASTRDADIVGYTVWFFVICFICMASVLLTVICHCICFRQATFTVSIHMHFLMAIFFFQFCFVIDAFLSPDQILAINTSSDNSKCIAMGLFIHYFFLAQFTWIVTQAINLWKVLVMNDEHTDRHYVVFFIIGWGVPLVILAIFYATTFNIYKYHTSLAVDFIYGDVNNNGEICFLTNGFAAIGGILAPVLFTVLMAGVVLLKAYQLSAQWQSYDDLFYGRLNAIEIPLLLLTWCAMILTCLWLALHLIYGYLWMMVLFCICNLILAILVFVLYAVIRNPILSCIFGPSTTSYSVSGDAPELMVGEEKPYNRTPVASSVKGSRASLLLND